MNPFKKGHLLVRIPLIRYMIFPPGSRMGLERRQSAGGVAGRTPLPCGRSARKGASGPTHPPLRDRGCGRPPHCLGKDTNPPFFHSDFSTAMPPKKYFYTEERWVKKCNHLCPPMTAMTMVFNLFERQFFLIDVIFHATCEVEKFLS